MSKELSRYFEKHLDKHSETHLKTQAYSQGWANEDIDKALHKAKRRRKKRPYLLLFIMLQLIIVGSAFLWGQKGGTQPLQDVPSTPSSPSELSPTTTSAEQSQTGQGIGQESGQGNGLGTGIGQGNGPGQGAGQGAMGGAGGNQGSRPGCAIQFTQKKQKNRLKDNCDGTYYFEASNRVVDETERGSLTEGEKKEEARLHVYGWKNPPVDIKTNIAKVQNKYISSYITAIEEPYKFNFSYATIILPYAGNVHNIFECAEDKLNLNTLECSDWKITETPFIINETNIQFVTTHFTAFGAGANSNLTIFDSNDTEGGNNILNTSSTVINFFANYTDVNGVVLTGATCQIMLNVSGIGPYTMAYDSNMLTYNYSRTIEVAGEHYWNVTCSKDGYSTIIPNDTVILFGNSVPVIEIVNVTPKIVNASIFAAATWNYTDKEGDVENGTIYKWFINGQEAWKDTRLVGYWKLDENARDYSNYGNNGSETGATLQPNGGIIKGAYSFDADGDYISVAHTASLSPTNITVAMWTTLGNVPYNGNIALNKEGQYRLFAGDCGVSTISSRAAGWGCISGTTILETNKWYHAVLSNNGTHQRLYLNGKIEYDSTSGTISGGSSGLLIGSYSGASYSWNGKLDEVKIWDQALSADEVMQEYQMMKYGQTEKLNESMATDIPIAAFQFTETSGASASDYFGDLEGAITNASLEQPGKWSSSQSYYFDGASAFIQVPTAPILQLGTGDFTIEAWVNIEPDTNNNLQAIATKTNGTTGFFLMAAAGGGLSFQVLNNTGDNIGIGGAEIRDGTWHHIMAGRLGNTIGLYLDGELIGGAEIGEANLNVGNDLLIGQRNNTAGYLNGSIDYLAFYNKAFSATEVNQSFTRPFPIFGYDTSGLARDDNLTIEITPNDGRNGTPRYHSLNISGVDPRIFWFNNNTNQTRTTPGSQIKFNVTWNATANLSSYMFSINQTGEWINTSWIGFGGLNNVSTNISNITAAEGAIVQWMFSANDTLGQINRTDIFEMNIFRNLPLTTRVNITPNPGYIDTYLSGNWNYSDEQGDGENGTVYLWQINGTPGWKENRLVGYWKLDGNAVDATDHRNNGTVNGATNSSNQGMIKDAYRFDGINDYINISNSPIRGISTMTIAMWVKIDGDVANMLIENLELGSSDPSFEDVGGLTPLFYVANAGGASFGTLTKGKWYHLLGTIDGTNMSTYQNGNLINSMAFASSVGTTAGNFYLGSRGGASLFFNGTIDEVKIWNRSLSAEEAHQEYYMMKYGQTEKNRAGSPAPDLPTHLFQFNEIRGGTTRDYFGDVQGKFENGAIIANKTDGLWGTTSVYLEGTDEYVNINKTTLKGNGTIETWLAHPGGFDSTALSNQFVFDTIEMDAVVPGELALFFNEANGNLTFSIIDSSNTLHQVNSTTASWNAGQAYHIAATWGNEGMQLYINGVQEGNNTDKVWFGQNSTFTSYIGAMIAGGGDASPINPFFGVVDNFAIYDRQLSPSEIEQIYTRRFPHFGYNTSIESFGTNLIFEVTPSDGLDYGEAANSSNASLCVIPINDYNVTQEVTFCSGNYNLADSGTAGVIIINVSDVAITCLGTVLNGSGSGTGVYQNTGRGNTRLQGCNITNYANDVRLLGENNTITQNSLREATYGLLIENSAGNSITNNTIAHCNVSWTTGIQFDGVRNSTVEANQFINNFYDFATSSSGTNAIFNNTFYDTAYYSISIGGGNTNFSIFKNRFHKKALSSPTDANFIVCVNDTGNYYNSSVATSLIDKARDCGPARYAEVRVNGSMTTTFNWNASDLATYHTLGEGLYNVGVGRNVTVMNGTYNEISESLRDNVAVTCNNSLIVNKAGSGILIDTEHNYLIKSCEFLNQTYGINIINSENITLVNNKLTDSNSADIILQGNTYWIRIENNTMIKQNISGDGVQIGSGSNISIAGNVFVNKTIGVNSANQYTDIYNNTFKDMVSYAFSAPQNGLTAFRNNFLGKGINDPYQNGALNGCVNNTGNFYNGSVPYLQVLPIGECGPTPLDDTRVNITMGYNFNWNTSGAVYSSIQEAIYNTNQGKTINLTDALYNEAVDIRRNSQTLDCRSNTLKGGASSQSALGGAINLYSGNNVTIRNCKILNYTYGLEFYGGGNSTASGNLIANCTRGIDIATYEGTMIANNTIRDNPTAGIFIQGGTSAQIVDNTFHNNSLDIDVESGTANNATRNQFLGCTTPYSCNAYGLILVKCTDSCFRLFRNNFKTTTPYITTWSGGPFIFNYSSFGGNYWQNYDTIAEGCNDADSDGYCDQPYNATLTNVQGVDSQPYVDLTGWYGKEPGVASLVNITPLINMSVYASGTWNYSYSGDGAPENGSLYVWYLNKQEAWKDSSLIGYWKLDANGQDSSGFGNNLSTNDATSQKKGGIISGGYSFDGVNDTMNATSSNSLLFNDTLTIAMWVRINHAPAAEDKIIAIKNTAGAGSNGFIAFIQTTGAVRFCSPNTCITSDLKLNTDSWNHVVFMQKGSIFNVSINGVLNSSTSSAQILNGSDSDQLYFGSRRGDSEFFNGTLDEIKMFNRTLTTIEIQQEYQMMKYGQTERSDTNGTGAPEAPLHLFEFNEVTGTNTYDYFGDVIGKLEGGAVFNTAGKWGTSAMNFDGTTNYVNINKTRLYGNGTVEAWILHQDGFSSSSTGDEYVVDSYEVNDAIGEFALFFNEKDGNLTFKIIDGNGIVYEANTTRANWSAGTWYHIAATWGRDGMKVYVNGTEEGNNSAIPWFGQNETYNTYIGGMVLGGGDATGVNTFLGKIESVALYDRQLTFREIQQHRQRGYPHFGYDTSMAYRGENLTFGVTPYNGFVYGAQVNSSVKNIFPLSFVIEANVTPTRLTPPIYPSAEWTYKDVNGTVQPGAIYTWFINNTEAWRENNLVGYWKFDSDSEEQTDSSNYGNNGTVHNRTFFENQGAIRHSFNWDGIASYINMSNSSSLQFTNATSISFWIRIASPPPADTILMIKNTDGSSTTGFNMSLNKTGFLRFCAPSNCISSSSLQNNAPTHVVIMQEGVIANISFNGAIVKSSNTGEAFNGADADPLYIGSRRGTSEFFNGTIDELKIYNKTLTLAEIHQEFQMMKYGQTDKCFATICTQRTPQSLWLFNEGTGGNTKDIFGNHTAAINGANWTTGRFGTPALTFDGIDDNIITNVSLTMNVTTVTMWIKRADRFNSTSTGSEYLWWLETGDDENAWVGFNVSTGKLVYNIRSNDSGTATDEWVNTSTNNWGPGGWVYLVMTCDGSFRKIFVNGNLVGNISSTRCFNSLGSNGNLSVGSSIISGAYGNSFNGTIDDMAFYDRLYLGSDISLAANKRFPPFGYNISNLGKNDSIHVEIKPNNDFIYGGAKNSTTLAVAVDTVLFWSNNNTNTTTISSGDMTRFNVTWDSIYGLKRFMFGTNMSGSWANTTWIALGGYNNISTNVTTINVTKKTSVGWKMYVQDINNNFNETPEFKYLVTNKAPNVTKINSTPYSVLPAIYPAIGWRYYDHESDWQNGTVYTWYKNGTEAWRDNGLIGYWRFDGEGNGKVIDISGYGNNGTVNGATNITRGGIIKDAYQYDGSNDYINISHGAALNFSNTLTISFWMYLDSYPVGESKIVIMKNEAGFGDRGFLTYLNETGHLRICSPNACLESTVPIGTGVWTHVGFLRSGTTGTIYLNGYEVTSGDTGETINGGDIDQLYINGRRGASEFFAGRIDELKMYNRTLNVEELFQEYMMMNYGQTEKESAGTPAPDIPKYLYSLNEMTGTQTYDYFGGIVGKLENGTTWPQGLWGTTAGGFEGLDNYVNVNGTVFTGNGTIEAWVKFDENFTAGAPSDRIVLDTFDISGAVNGELAIFFNAAEGNMTVSITDLDGVMHQVNSSTNNWNAGQWYHIATTWGANGIRVYVDGTLENSIADAIWFAQNGSFGTYIGAYITGSGSADPLYSFNGTIEEFAIYDRQLTNVEIGQVHDQRFPHFGYNSSLDSLATIYRVEIIPSDDMEFGNRINSSNISLCVVPVNDYNVISDTKFCPGFYNIADTGQSGVINVTKSNVTVECLNTALNGTISGGVTTFGFHTAETSTNNITIANCNITNYDSAIRLRGENNTIIGQYIRSVKYGIDLQEAMNTLIENNTINTTRDDTQADGTGIYLTGGSNNTINANTFIDNSYGIYYYGTSIDNLAKNNTFSLDSTAAFSYGETATKNNSFFLNKFHTRGLPGVSSEYVSLCVNDTGNYYNHSVPVGDIIKNYDCGVSRYFNVTVNKSKPTSFVWNGSGASFETLQEALNSGYKDKTITIASGFYTNASISVHDNVTIVCDGAELNGMDRSANLIYIDGESEYTIRNCRFANFSTAIRINANENNTLLNNTFSNVTTSGYGINVESAGQYITIANNTFIDNSRGNGISSLYSNTTIIGNRFSNNSYGINIGGGSEVYVLNNTFEKSVDGSIYLLWTVSNASIYKNYFNNRGITGFIATGVECTNNTGNYYNFTVPFEDIPKTRECGPTPLGNTVVNKSMESNFTWNGSATYKTIKEAIYNTNNGRTITIYDGSYNETIDTVQDNVKIKCANASLNDVPSEEGFYLNGENNIVIENCRIMNYSYGLRIEYSNNNSFINNTITNSTAYGAYLLYAHNNTLGNNTFIETKDNYAVELQSSFFGLFIKNIFSNNTKDIYLWTDVIENNYTQNIFNGCNLAGCIYIGGGNFNTTWYRNTFNHSPANYITTLSNFSMRFNHSTFGGNYWQNYDTAGEGCNDANGNGFCDNPYTIDSNSFAIDYQPFTTDIGWTGTDPGNASRVNITPQYINNSAYQNPAGTWNYSWTPEGSAEIGSTYKWFINRTEAWKETTLVGYWRLDENALDSSNYGNNGTISGATGRTNDGIIKGAYRFDGINDYINTSNGPVTGLSAMTIAMWVKIDGDAINMLIENLQAGSSDPSIEDTVGLTPLFYVANAGGASFGTLTKGKWYHLTGTIDGTNMSAYQNGKLVTSIAFASSVGTTAGNLYLGSRGGTSLFFNGTIDEVKIWNRSLSAEEANQEYMMMKYGQTEKNLTSGSPAQDIPTHLFSFNEDTTTKDFFGDIQTKFENGALLGSGKFGTNGALLDGVNDYINVNGTALKGNGTIEMWVSITGGFSSANLVDAILFDTLEINGDVTGEMRIFLNEADGNITFRITDSAGTVHQVNSTTSVWTDAWTHLAFSWGSQGMHVYVNGRRENNNTDTQWFQQNRTSVSYIGAYIPGSGNATGNNTFTGTIDELAVFDRQMTTEEINQSYWRRFPQFGYNISGMAGNSTLIFEVTPFNNYIFGPAVNSSNVTVIELAAGTIASCGVITTTTTLNNNVITNADTCFNITGNNVVFDCNGYTVDGNNSALASVAVLNTTGVTVKNCNLTKSIAGIWLVNGANNTVVTTNNFTRTGMVADAVSSAHNNITITGNNNIGLLTLDLVNASTIRNNTIGPLSAYIMTDVVFVNNSFANCNSTNLTDIARINFSGNAFTNYTIYPQGQVRMVNNSFTGGDATAGYHLVAIQGSGIGSSLIDNSFTNGGPEGACLQVAVNNVNIQGNNFFNCLDSWAILVVPDITNTTIFNNTIRTAGFQADKGAITIQGGNDTRILRNEFNATTTSIIIQGNNTLIANNSFKTNYNFGIIITSVRGSNTIWDNRFINTTLAPIFMNSATLNRVRNNTYIDMLAANLYFSDSLANSLLNTEILGAADIENSTTGSDITLQAAFNVSAEVFLNDSFNLKKIDVIINDTTGQGLKSLPAQIILNYTDLQNATAHIGIDEWNDGVFVPCTSFCTITGDTAFKVTFLTTALAENRGYARYKATRFYNLSNAPAGLLFSNIRNTTITMAESGQVVQLRNGSLRMDFAANGGVNLTGFNLSANDTRTAATGWNQIVNVSSTYALYLPMSNGYRGLYACPNMIGLANVVSNCENVTRFEGPFPQTKAVGGELITVGINGSDYRIDGFANTGAAVLEGAGGNITEVGGAAVTVVRREKGVSQTVIIPITGGNITGLYVNAQEGTRKWQGYYGNVTGELVLGSGGNRLYGYGISNVLLVAASQDPNFNFQQARKANVTLMDNVYGFDTTETDSATLAFNETGITMGGIPNVPYLSLTGGTWRSGIVDNSSPAPGNPGLNKSYAFFVEVNMNKTNFAGNYSDFEMIVPVPQSGENAGTATYYFFIDLG